MKSQFIKSLYEHMMLKRYAKRTIQTYINWISDYIRFHKLQHPKDLDVLHVEAYLTHLSTKRKMRGLHKPQHLMHWSSCTTSI